MAVFLAWLTDFLTKLLGPVIQNMINNSVVASKVDRLEKQNDALIKAFAQYQSAKTPQEIQDAIKAIAAADNS